jgi:TldD protein
MVFFMSRDSRGDEVYDILEGVGNIIGGTAEYWDALYDSQSQCIINKDNVDERVSTPELTGILVRAFKDGVWFSSGTYKIEKRAVGDMAKKLIKTVQKPKRAIKLKPLAAQKIDSKFPAKRDPTTVQLEEKLKRIREVHDIVSKSDKRIINAQVRYGDGKIERIFVNSEGSRMRQSVPRTRIIIVPIAREGDKIRADFASLAQTEGFEVIERTNFDEVCGDIVKSSIELLGAKTPPSGEITAVVDPSMAGIIAHESFGHGLEADQVIRDRSYLASLVGKKVASDQTTIYDSSALPAAWGSYAFDDEGVPARQNVLVKNGILKGFLHDRLTASALEAEPTSSCRVESFLTKHFVRMSNTYFASGDMTLEELLEPIKTGVMLVHANFGMEDPLGGGMQVTSNKGYMIENGKATLPLTEVALSGSVLDLLKSIDGASKDFKVDGGTCGKGSEDYVPVGSGGGYVRIRKAIVSGG